jgi:hypothetical protein
VYIQLRNQALSEYETGLASTDAESPQRNLYALWLACFLVYVGFLKISWCFVTAV